MERYVLKNGQWINRATGEPMVTPDRLAMPMIISDIPEYPSPIDGRPITSRSARRDDLRRNNCVEYDDSLRKKHPKYEAFEERRKRALKESA